MKIEEFDRLSEIEKEEIVFDDGEFLGSDNIDNTMFDIYRIDDFYVQFSYEMNKNERAKIATFQHPHDIFVFNKAGVSNIPSSL